MFFASACEEVIVPVGCVSIGSKAFANCVRLRHMVIPASVAEDAFEGCAAGLVIERTE